MTLILRVARAVFRHHRPNMTALNNPMSGWTKMKIQLGKISSITDWWQLDIHFTVGINMAEPTVPLLTISRILNQEYKTRLLLATTTPFIQPTARVRRSACK